MNKGKIISIIGPVVDIEFGEKLPEIYNAIEVKNGNKKLVPFDLLLLRKLAKKLRYFGSLYEVSKW